MKNEIQIFYDKELKKEVYSNIEFEPIKAGNIVDKILFIKNNLPFLLKLNISIEGKDITIENNLLEIKSNEIKEVRLKLNARITSTTPINANIKLNGEYIIE